MPTLAKVYAYMQVNQENDLQNPKTHVVVDYIERQAVMYLNNLISSV